MMMKELLAGRGVNNIESLPLGSFVPLLEDGMQKLASVSSRTDLTLFSQRLITCFM